MTRAQRRLVFLHVPKTAGSTLQSIVRRQFTAQELFSFDGPHWTKAVAQLPARDPAELERVRCVIGHVPMGIHEWFPGPASYMTMLREPVDWTLSFYFAMSTKPQALPLLQTIGRESMSLERFIEFLVETGLANLQTRMLAGGMDVRKLLPPFDPLPDHALESATTHLREMVAVGVVERFDESVLLLRHRLGWRNVHYGVRNVTRKRPRDLALSDGLRDAICDCQSLDVALYAEALRRVTSEVEEIGPAFADELRRFRRTNALYGAARDSYQALRLPALKRTVGRWFAR